MAVDRSEPLELRDANGRTWRCEAPAKAGALVAHVEAGPELWRALVDGLDDDPRAQVAAPWWLVEAEAGRAAVRAADAVLWRLRTLGLVGMGLAAALAGMAWAVPLAFVPPAARGGLGFLIVLMLGLPALIVYLSGTGSLQFGARNAQRRLGAKRTERAEREFRTVEGPVGPTAIVPDTLAHGEEAALAAVVRRVLALPGVEGVIVVTPFADRQAALATATGRDVESARLRPIADA